jgi:hypothetical protein
MRDRPLARALLVVASLLAVFVVAEVSLRVFAPWWSDQWKMWRLDPVYARGLRAGVQDARVHAHSGEFVFQFSTNAQGFRMDRDVPPRAPVDRERVVFVGDSFTFGYGVDQGMTFVDRFDTRAEEAHLPLDVVNAGFASGYTLDTEYLFTREMKNQLHPDRVIVGLCIANDLADLDSTRWHIEDGNLVALEKHNDWIPGWVKRSAFVNWLVKGAIPGLRSRGAGTGEIVGGVDACEAEVVAAPRLSWRADLQRTARPASAAMSSEEKVAWLLDTWAREAAAADYDLTLLLIPDGREVQSRIHPGSLAAWARVRGIFAKAAANAGVAVLDPVTAMRTERCPDGDDFYYRRDGHWTERGHRFVGDWLFDTYTSPPPLTAARP